MKHKFSHGLVAIVLAAVLTGPAWAQLTPYSQDFEGLDLGDPDALVNDDWFAFVNAFASYPDVYLYGYPLPAFNGGERVSALVPGQGGPDQGAQQLSVYSDYAQSDHANGIIIETNLYRQYQVTPENVGQTWVFKFDAKRGNINEQCGIFPCQSTALAFIKVFPPDFSSLPIFLVFPTTDLPDTWGTYEVPPLYIDPGLVNFFVQVGFLNTATYFQDSGMFYDNVSFAEVPPIPCEPDPTTQGYWHRQCLGVPEGEGGIDPGRNGRGPQSPTEPGFVDELMPCAFARLEAAGLFGLMTCEGMDADPASDACQKAEKQLTALILNVCSGRVQETCLVDLSAQGCLSTDLDGLIVELAGYIQAGSCQQASACAATINEGFGLFDGAEPATIEPAAATRDRVEGKGRGKLGRR